NLSPKSLASTSNSNNDSKYKEFDKVLLDIFYMSPWNVDELEICQEKIFLNLDKNLMKEIYDRVGGVPRYVLQVAEEMSEKIAKKDNSVDSHSVIISYVFQHIEQAINELQEPIKLLQCMSENSTYVSYSSRLLHLWPLDETYRKAR